MSELTTEGLLNVQKRGPSNHVLFESKVQLLFLGLLSISFVGYFALRQFWIGFIFGHLAALSIMGFYGCLAGTIAKKKGYEYWRAFRIGFFIPLILGCFSAVLFVPDSDKGLPLSCGGWVSLAAGLAVVISYFLIKRKDNRNQI
ncbi:hypothetical protein ACFL27_23170 [candidate division CSSED10-310 bacterium]|uniref:Uncharacterized protein n=1 Tax=candidate division CSSED10-310 bacterium TaxID=2855610 RepID=A0ABV6Z3X4_UNCC1